MKVIILFWCLDSPLFSTTIFISPFFLAQKTAGSLLPWEPWHSIKTSWLWLCQNTKALIGSMLAFSTSGCVSFPIPMEIPRRHTLCFLVQWASCCLQIFYGPVAVTLRGSSVKLTLGGVPTLLPMKWPSRRVKQSHLSWDRLKDSALSSSQTVVVSILFQSPSLPLAHFGCY